jgi:peptidoglycan L-alanyl-D-glutamate endopeptidase CwlK
MDQVTIDRIKMMHPTLRDELLEQYLEINKALPVGVRLRFAYTYRSPKEQHELFNKVPKITQSDAWQSIHQYGLAFDIVMLLDENKDGKFESISYKNDKNWKAVVAYFKSKGWEWGGDWKSFKDAPHFQKANGNTWRSLKKKIDGGDSFKDDNGIIYINL